MADDDKNPTAILPCIDCGRADGFHRWWCRTSADDERVCAHRGNGEDCECNGDDQPEPPP